MTIPERAVLREETRLLGRELAALDADQQLFILLVLAGSDPDAVRQALDTERATRPAGGGGAVSGAGDIRTVPLAVIEDQKARGWPDFHPEDYCHRCGRRNISWYTDSSCWNEAWAQVEPGVQSVLCPQCFAELWERATGLSMSWEIQPDRAVLLSRLRRHP